MSNMQKMLKKAQQMQRDVEKAQNELSDMEITHQGNGITVTAKGDFTLKSVKIEPGLLEDREMLEDCLMVTVNAAMDRIRKEMEKRMAGITGGFNIPGLF